MTEENTYVISFEGSDSEHKELINKLENNGCEILEIR